MRADSASQANSGYIARRGGIRPCLPPLMRLSKLILCTLGALAPCLSLASSRSIYVQNRRGAVVPLPLSAKDGLQTPARGDEATLIDVLDKAVVDGLDDRRQADSYVVPWEESQPSATDAIRSYEDGAPDSDNPDPESDSGEQDFTSSPTPIHQGRWRAGLLGILAALCVSYHSHPCTPKSIITHFWILI